MLFCMEVKPVPFPQKTYRELKDVTMEWFLGEAKLR